LKTAIVSVLHTNAKDLKALSDMLLHLKDIANIEKVSSVYELTHADTPEQVQHLSPIGQALSLCFLLSFEGASMELNEKLKELEKQSNQGLDGSSIYVQLLAFENEISMLPSLSLPDPSLHTDGKYLKPASEIYPNYLHPVLDQTLSEILYKLENIDGVQFYARSKSLEELS
tara:strand:- start:10286 stop:10801 length:516 start_codon:yes stop_codon:yes gene_type:complete